ncbi:MAG: hypothetical protein IPP18_01740 [Rhodocyclaceae bacterium]|nr:hypothetical protein [Rhodocyclaceae bacterium]
MSAESSCLLVVDVQDRLLITFVVGKMLTNVIRWCGSPGGWGSGVGDRAVPRGLGHA